MGKYALLLFASWLVPLLPARVARPLAEWIGLAAWAAAPATRRRVAANLRHVPGLARDTARLRWATRSIFRHAALNYVDFLRGSHLSDAELRARWAIEGEEQLEAAVAQGHGAVVLTGHFGNFELGVSRLGAMGYDIVAPAEHLRPERLYRLFCRLREHHRLRVYPADSRATVRQLVESLERGALATFVADRHVAGASVEVAFFGAPARLPTAPMALALRSGAPVLAIFCWRAGDGYSHGVVMPLDVHGPPADEVPTRAPAAARDGADVPPGAGSIPVRGLARTPARERSGERTARAMELFIRALERRIEAHPEQWVSALATVWE